MRKPHTLIVFAILFTSWIIHARAAESCNDAVLAAIRSMPKEGGYAVTAAATRALESAIGRTATELSLAPHRAVPSYCSGATYLVFLDVVHRLMNDGRIRLDSDVLSALLVKGQRDGQGVWGRWNANGPGTARLFFELKLGRNFTAFDEARPGDFMKIFWTPEVGSRERGHSVVYMGTETRGGVEHVKFWSSNQGAGYGQKSVPKSKIAHAVFSRLERPENLSGKLPGFDPYLGSLLTKPSSIAEMRTMCGFN